MTEIREVSCDGCNARKSGYLSTIHTLMFGIKHEAGCSTIHSPSYTAHEIKRYSGEERTYKIDHGGNIIA